MLGIKTEPTIVINALSETIRQLLPLMVVLDVIHLSSEKLGALSIAIGLILGFFTTLFTRAQTVSVDTANKQIQVAVASPEGTSVEDVVAATAAKETK
jgi:hypothetical protein